MEYFESGQTPPEPPYQPEPPQQRLEPHRSLLVLIFGIIGLFSCAIFALLAWVFGNEDLKKMDDGRMDPSGRDTTNVGRILGIIGVGLNVLGLMAALIWMVFIFGVSLAGMKGLF